MNAPARLATFGLGLVTAFAAGMGIGSAVGPVGPAAPDVEMPAEHGSGDPAHGAGPATGDVHEEPPR